MKAFIFRSNCKEGNKPFDLGNSEEFYSFIPLAGAAQRRHPPSAGGLSTIHTLLGADAKSLRSGSQPWDVNCRMNLSNRSQGRKCSIDLHNCNLKLFNHRDHCLSLER
ncbi:hypothetical protein PGIGA_G00173280 [Pangasianodon gigas]|uniref:Uncharacterized protein n=1 Tax=Pangasianodon gigas TaxID=30993 RepID=A0ACC5XUN5_PANGG|nr:hypothetical protein [Pangasianodon gigas]